MTIKERLGVGGYPPCVHLVLRLDNFIVPMQWTGNSRCFSRGKRAATVRRFQALFSLCTMFSCFHTNACEAYSFTTNGYGIFINVRTNLAACHTHEGGGGVGEGRSGTSKSAQE